MLSTIHAHLSSATPTQRVIFGIFMNLPFLLAFLAAQSVGFFVDEWRQLMNVRYVMFANSVLAAAIVIQLVLLKRLWPIRKSREAIPKTSTFFAIIVATALSSEAFMGGNLTFPTNLVIIAIVPIGLLLLDIKSVGIALLVGIGYMLLNDILIHADIVPYAPGYSPKAFEGGEHHFMAEVFRSGILYTSVIAYGFIIATLAYQADFHRDRLILMSRMDPLTGISNRRYFMERLEEECGRQKRTGLPMCLAMIDADHFKNINDTYGHVMGDEVLRGIAQVLSEHMRVPEDLPARLGGEEFAILFSDTTLDGANRVCERIQNSLSEMAFQHAGKSFYVTLSIGLVEGRELDADTLLHFADANMYRAKALGRNTIVSTQEKPGGDREKLASMA